MSFFSSLLLLPLPNFLFQTFFLLFFFRINEFPLSSCIRWFVFTEMKEERVEKELFDVFKNIGCMYVRKHVGIGKPL